MGAQGSRWERRGQEGSERSRESEGARKHGRRARRQGRKENEREQTIQQVLTGLKTNAVASAFSLLQKKRALIHLVQYTSVDTQCMKAAARQY
eukprot:4340999-Pleurochrysis_carterae.AAC.1